MSSPAVRAYVVNTEKAAVAALGQKEELPIAAIGAFRHGLRIALPPGCRILSTLGKHA